MNIINDNTFNLYNSLLNNDNRHMKVTQKSNRSNKISAEYRKF